MENDKITPVEKKNPVGAPSTYNQETADIICSYLAEGMSMRRIEKIEGMPSITAMFKWLRTHEEFAQQYARAKQESTAALFEEMSDIVDDGTNDWMEDQYMKGKSPGWKVNGEAVQRSKLRWDDRRWKLSKLMPKKYGDKLDLTTDGQPIQAITGMRVIETIQAIDVTPVEILSLESPTEPSSETP
jgi:hypothetical protein